MASASGSVATIFRKHPAFEMHSIIFLLIASSTVCRSQTSSGKASKFGDGIIVFPTSTNSNPNPKSNTMDVLYSWRLVDFTFPDDNTRETMIQNKQFIPKNNLILDVDIVESEGNDPTVFVTLPRVRPGVPVTLATVSSSKRNGANLLAPYPDWATNTPGDCDTSITSVFRTHVDECGRLWVLDSGNNNAFAGGNLSRIICPPQIIIYDTRNKNKLVDKFRIPKSMLADNSLLVTIAVDTRSSDCSDSYAYIADAIAYKMIVFHLPTKQFWRINSIYFQAYPDHSMFTINDVSFALMGGIFGMGLGPVFSTRRLLYFHCIDSVKQSWVETDDLRDQSLWMGNMNAKPRAFKLYNGTRPTQSAAATMNKDGVMFFGLIATNEIACWNSQTPFYRRNIVSLAKNDKTLQFNSGIKVFGDKLYAVTCRLQNYLNNKVNEDEINYRVLVGDVRKMTKGTSCEVDPTSNRIDTGYEPNTESVDYPGDDDDDDDDDGLSFPPS